MSTNTRYSEYVFINCPFDEQYKDLFDAMVFAVIDCGFIPRCALEDDDSSMIRLEKIIRIIGQCQYAIHDISRTELDKVNKLPRFNMPLELGLFLGAKRYGYGKQKKKKCLILDHEQYRYQKFMSDIAGQDIRPHDNAIQEMIIEVRNWLRNASRRKTLSGGHIIFSRYTYFRKELPKLCKRLKLSPKELIYSDYKWLVYEWLKYADKRIEGIK